MSPRRAAFTLVEMLVALAVMGTLAGMLFPAFGAARERGRAAVCLSNARQLGMALLLYAGDYDETLPGNESASAGLGLRLGWRDPAAGRNWCASLEPYVRNLALFRCPSASPRGYAGWDDDGAPGIGLTAYLLNGVVAGRPLAAIPEPAGVIFLQESRYLTRAAQVRPEVIPGSSPPSAFHLNHDSYNLTHFGGGDLLFCDGHAAWREKARVRFAEFGVRGGACPEGRTTHAPPVSDAEHAESCPLAF